MWGLVPPKIKVAAILVLVVIVVIARYAIIQKMPAFDSELLRSILATIGSVSLLGAFLGTRRWAWTVPCRLGLAHWFPNINGTWEEYTQSSFKDASGTTRYPIVVNIDQKWSHIRVEVRNPEGKRLSISKIAIPVKTDEVPEIWMHFEGEGYADADHPTDEQRYLGSARYRFDMGPDKLSGAYWTNRAAHILGCGGTAGTVELERKQ